MQSVEIFWKNVLLFITEQYNNTTRYILYWITNKP